MKNVSARPAIVRISGMLQRRLRVGAIMVKILSCWIAIWISRLVTMSS